MATDERRDAPLYRYWPISERPPIRWPEGKRMACYIALNIEHFHLGERSTSRTAVTAGLPVDPLNHGWRDYGTRVGFWRMLRLFDRYELPVSALLNADACSAYPQIIEAGLERGWAWVAHGATNSRMWTGMNRADERAALAEIVETMRSATGGGPRGWLGPALTETRHTPELLAELGFTYTMDWVNDDQPFPLDVAGSRFISVPYSIEINDIPVFVDQSTTPAEFTRMIIDQFDVLYEESGVWPSPVFSVSLHPFLVGQPFRYPHLEAALRHLRDHDDVWFCTTDEIADWYLEHHYDEAIEALNRTAG